MPFSREARRNCAAASLTTAIAATEYSGKIACPPRPAAGGRPPSAARRARWPRAASVAAGQPQLPFPPLELVSKDELESIHRAALTVLEEIGIDFLHDGARAILKDAGADVDAGSKRVRFDPALVEAQIGLAPREFTLHARNPARTSRDRRAARRLRLGRQRAQRLRPRGRAQARDDRRLPQLHPARPDVRRRSTSGAAIRSSRSTCIRRCAISTRCSTC